MARFSEAMRTICGIAGMLPACLCGCSSGTDGGTDPNFTQRVTDRMCSRSTIYPAVVERAEAA